jgi:hypothetical protein
LGGVEDSFCVDCSWSPWQHVVETVVVRTEGLRLQGRAIKEVIYPFDAG